MNRVMITFFMICLFITSTVYANDLPDSNNVLYELEIINKNYFKNSDTVSRGECLTAIMRVIGLTDEDVDVMDGADFVPFADVDPYSYFGCAYRMKIAFGVECEVDYPTYRTSHTGKSTDYFFFPERTVKIKEALAFMVRCLEENTDYDSVIDNAKEHQLIKDDDKFAVSPDDAITSSDFCTLLERLLKQKRYKYYDGKAIEIWQYECVDEGRSITYIESLLAR